MMASSVDVVDGSLILALSSFDGEQALSDKPNVIISGNSTAVAELCLALEQRSFLIKKIIV
jgi:hypothetical protein